MTLGAAQIGYGPQGWHITRQPGPDLQRLMVGKPVAEVADLLPRLFNLCRMAQASAARLTLRLPAPPDAADAIRLEILRDHLARLFVTLRLAFDLPPLPLPERTDAITLFGPTGHLPTDVAALDNWLAGDLPAAELGRSILRDFPGQSCAAPPLPPPPSGHHAGPFENSPAQRQAAHPLLVQVAARHGRGPIWRYLGLLVDLQAALACALPGPKLLADGTAVAPAARGSYALRIMQQDGRLTGLWRQTPTDHQLAPQGALDHALRGLPKDRPDLARRLVALHDPCIPVTVAEVSHA